MVRLPRAGVSVGPGLRPLGSARPPGGSRRAALPHRALAAGHDAKVALPCVSARAARLARRSGAGSGTRFALADCPWPTPFPPRAPPPLARFCSPASQVLWSCPTRRARSSRDYALGLALAASAPSAEATTTPPGFRAWCVRACAGSTTAAEPLPARDNADSDIAFRARPNASASAIDSISRLNTRPARTPVNASPPASRQKAHDSENKMDRYSFLVGLLHPRHHAGFGRRFRTGLSFKLLRDARPRGTSISGDGAESFIREGKSIT